jgi:non-heme Fe2+,alpha-ketoglutarate-dependent halogenase
MPLRAAGNLTQGTEMSTFLTREQQQEYRHTGFLFPIDVMSIEAAAHHCYLLDNIERLHGSMHYRVKPYLIVGSARQIATHPTLLDAVESILGPDILLWDSSYVIKEAGSMKPVSWHQDLLYWGLQMDSDYDLVSAWVALTPATQANVSMRFVRGSHLAGPYQHVDTHADDNILHRGQTIVGGFDAAEITEMELVAGQASLHHGWTVHSSGSNLSTGRRIDIVFNFLKPGVRQVVGDHETGTLVRGEHRFGHFGAEPDCVSDFAPGNVAFQLEVERKKREVYDTA